jgi:hypothetical protein
MPTLKMLKDLTPARMRKKLKMQVMPVLKLQHSDLCRLEVMLLSLLLDPALQMPMSLLPLLHLPTAQPPPLLLRLCKKTLKYHQIPGMPGAVVRYTLFALVCYLNKFYFGLLAY